MDMIGSGEASISDWNVSSVWRNRGLGVVAGEQGRRPERDGPQEPDFVRIEVPGGARRDPQHPHDVLAGLERDRQDGARAFRVRLLDLRFPRQGARRDSLGVSDAGRGRQPRRGADHQRAALVDQERRRVGGQRPLKGEVGQLARGGVGERSLQRVQRASRGGEALQGRGLRRVDLAAEQARLGQAEGAVIAEAEDRIPQGTAEPRRFRGLRTGARLRDQSRYPLRSELASTAPEQPGELPG